MRCVLLTAVAFLASLLLFPVPAQAQSLRYFDINGSTAGSGAPGGVFFLWATDVLEYWSTSSGGTSSTQLWQNGQIAVFGAGSDCWGVQTDLAGFNGPTMAGIRLEECDVTMSNNTLVLVGSGTELHTAGSLELSVSSQLDWPGTGFIRKTGSGLLEFVGATGDDGTPAVTDFDLEAGTLRLASSSSTNWFGGTSSADLTVGTGAGAANLDLGTADQLRDTTVVDLVDGAFRLNGHDETIRGLTGSGSVIGGGLLTINANSSDHLFSGSLTDGGTVASLTVRGTGSQRFDGLLEHSGATLVDSGGRLIIGGTLAASNVSVDNGELVSAGGEFQDIAIATSGTFELGIGTTLANQLAWNNGSTAQWVLGPTATVGDSAAVTASSLDAISDGTLTIRIDPSSNVPVSAQSYPLITYAAGSVSVGNFTVDDAGLLDDRDVTVRLESGTVWLDIGPLDGVFEDRFESSP
ncbi:MAG: hypothetical protein U5L08_13705 [Xanthomonadales bacterium]|nr:hypothetical protein [Xanthomonadales bacterium]